MTRQLVAWLCLWLACAAPAGAQIRAAVYVSGLNQPVAFVQDPSDPAVQLVVEQGGRIRIVRNGVLLSDIFLDLSSAIRAGGEQGLLGLAFAPDYVTSGRLFVNFTNPNGHTVIARFTRSATNPLRGDPASRFDLAFPGGQRFITQPFTNHNGGDLHFGPDGYLYIALGDGGSGNDPFNLAQNMTSLLGKVLRIDVRVPDAHVDGYTVPADNPFHTPGPTTGLAGSHPVRSLIWSLGWRNPWRFTFDDPEAGGTGAMVIADVGQNAWEEANYEPAGRGGRNYGWRIREGAHPTPAFGDPTTAGLTDPVLEYSHAVGNAITGGRVNRGVGLGAAYFGRYFFADINGRVWSARFAINASGEATSATIEEHTAELGGTAAIGTPVAFGHDASCRVYLVDYSGRIVRLAPATLSVASTCPGRDPFASSGGGVLVDGGWVPASHPLSGSPTTPSAPTPTVPTTSAPTCTGSAPVASWVCVGQGWVPPNHPLAAQGGTPAPPAPPAPPVSACTSADPFAGIPGLSGICINGGWVPAGHPLARIRREGN